MDIFEGFTGSASTVALLVGVFFFVGSMILGLQLLDEKQKFRRKQTYWRGRTARRKQGAGGGSRKPPNPSSRSDYAAEQLKKVSRASFTPRPLLNRAERKVFEALDSAVIERNPGWQVMAQVSLGEFLASPDRDAFFAVNSKRVDFALMDQNARVVHALEYQGIGHHTGNSAAARDAVKKEALRKAGIGYHEVVAGHTTPGDLRALVEKLVARPVEFEQVA